MELAVIIFEHGYGHPFPGEDQIRPAVVVKICPNGVANHSGTYQVSGHVLGYIGKLDLARPGIISINKTGNRFWIISRVHPAGNKQIQVSVMIKVCCTDTKLAGQVSGRVPMASVKFPYRRFRICVLVEFAILFIDISTRCDIEVKVSVSASKRRIPRHLAALHQVPNQAVAVFE
jgi:hypothetical protein